MKRPFFSVSAWLFGSLLAIVLINLALICVVSGADLLLGQPPQFIVPLCALLMGCATLMLSRRRASQAEALPESESEPAMGGTTAARRPRHHENAPGYVSMTIIKRPPVYASTPARDEWKGAVQ
jgi:hypothetical protein